MVPSWPPAWRRLGRCAVAGGWLACCTAVVTAGVAQASPAAPALRFVDATAEAGVAFVHRNGAEGDKRIPETMGSGVAFFDHDGDGHLDLYFVNSAGPAALYHNTGAGRFEEVTKAAGVGDVGFGMGVAVSDIDNDGDLDVYVTAHGPNRLFRNDGAGRFSEVAAAAGAVVDGLSTGAAFGDYDGDGDNDLYVANYVHYGPQDHQVCTRAQDLRVYCGPEAFEPAPDAFLRNEGDGTFADVSEQVGLLPAAAKELGASFTDYDDDGDLDLYVAGDRTANLLYRNEGGRFTETGVLAGAAFDDYGKPLAGMGLAVGDYDGDQRFDLFVTNYQWESNSLYRNLGEGLFAADVFVAGAGVVGLAAMGWGTVLFDADNDGDLDLYVANGHLDDNVHLFDEVSYPQRNHLLRNDGERFTDVSAEAGSGLSLAAVSRGAAAGDWDGDGDLDLAVNNNGGAAHLLRNDSDTGGWLGVRLVGGGPPHGSSRDAVGARLRVVVQGRAQTAEVRSGTSYMSQDDLNVFFGLGSALVADTVEVRWLGGRQQRLTAAAAGRWVTIREGE